MRIEKTMSARDERVDCGVRTALDARYTAVIHDLTRFDGSSIYRVHGLLATCILCAMCMVSGACKTAQPEPEPSPEVQQDEETEARARSQRTEDVLFDAIIEESKARGYELATVSSNFLTVITGYEQVSARLRKRRIMKIIILPRGGALNVNVSYERDAGVEGAPDWQVLEDEHTRTRAAQEEMELARAIEQRLHVMKRQRARQR